MACKPQHLPRTFGQCHIYDIVATPFHFQTFVQDISYIVLIVFHFDILWTHTANTMPYLLRFGIFQLYRLCNHFLRHLLFYVLRYAPL